MPPTKFQVDWPFGFGEEAKSRFKMAAMAATLGFLIEIILAIFDLLVTLMLPIKFRVNKPSGVGGGGLLNQIVDAARRTTHDPRRTTDIDRSQ